VKFIQITLLIAAVCMGVMATAKVACLGNSITVGGYPDRLRSRLGNGFEVKRFAVEGATLVLQPGTEYYYRSIWNTDEYQQSLAYQPDYVIIMLGTNDARTRYMPEYADRWVDDYLALIDSYKALNSNPAVICMIPAPVWSPNQFDILADTLSQRIIPFIREAVAQREVTVVDLYESLINHPELFPDGVHPDYNKGADTIAALAWNGFFQASTYLSSPGVTFTFQGTGAPDQQKTIIASSATKVPLGVLTAQSSESWLSVSVEQRDTEVAILNKADASELAPGVHTAEVVLTEEQTGRYFSYTDTAIVQEALWVQPVSAPTRSLKAAATPHSFFGGRSILIRANSSKVTGVYDIRGRRVEHLRPIGK